MGVAIWFLLTFVQKGGMMIHRWQRIGHINFTSLNQTNRRGVLADLRGKTINKTAFQKNQFTEMFYI